MKISVETSASEQTGYGDSQNLEDVAVKVEKVEDKIHISFGYREYVLTINQIEDLLDAIELVRQH